MPQVPVIQDRLDLEVPGVRSRVQSSPNAFGAQSAEALGALAAKAGGMVSAWDAKQDENDAKELDNQLSALIREQLYNPEQGYLTTQRGKNAVDGRQGAVEGLRTRAEEIASRARSRSSATLFRDVASRRLNDAVTTIYRHADEQNDVYEDELSDSRLKEFTNNAVASYQDPSAVQAQIAGGMGEIATIARRRGWSPEQTTERTRTFQSGVLSATIRRLGHDDPNQAQQIFDSVRGAMTAVDVSETENALREGTLLARSQAETDRIFGEFTDYADRLDAAREIEDPFLRDKVEDAVVQRQARNEARYASLKGRVFQAYANGRPLSSLSAEDRLALTTEPELGQFHAQIQDAYRSRAASYASGERVRSDGPIYHMMLRMAGSDRNAFRAAMEDPNVLAGMSQGDITELLKMLNSQEEGGGVTASNQIFRAVADVAEPMLRPYGVDLHAKPDDPVRRAFEYSLSREIEAHVRDSGGRMPNQQQLNGIIGRAIVNMDIDSVRGLPSSITAPREARNADGRRLATVGGIRQGDNTIGVPYDIIPVEERDAIQRRLRAIRGRQPNREEVVREYAGNLRGQGTFVAFDDIPADARNFIIRTIGLGDRPTEKNARAEYDARVEGVYRAHMERTGTR